MITVALESVAIVNLYHVDDGQETIDRKWDMSLLFWKKKLENPQRKEEFRRNL